MEFSVADRLARLRRAQGYSQGELARKLGLSRQAVSKWERAEAAPDTENLIALARLYGVTLDELAGLDAGNEAAEERSVRTLEPSAATGDAHPRRSDNGSSKIDAVKFGAAPVASGANRDAPADSLSGAAPGLDSDATGAPAPDAPTGGPPTPIALDPPVTGESPAGQAAGGPSGAAAPRVWRRGFYRAVVCVLCVALLALGALGWFALTGPHPRVTDALGVTSTHVDEINFSGIDRIVVNWPAGEVKIESMPTLRPLRIEEHGLDVVKQGCFQKKGSTLEVWAGDARAWDDREAIAHDLTISVPLSSPPSAVSAEDAPRLAELVLNTGYGSFSVENIEAEALDATMRDGSLGLARCSFGEYRFS